MDLYVVGILVMSGHILLLPTLYPRMFMIGTVFDALSVTFLHPS